MSQLKKWRMQVADDGSCKIIGFDQRGYKQVINSKDFSIMEFDTNYLTVDSRKDGKRFMCRFRDICWSQPMTPTRMHKKVSHKNNLWYAVNDLLAETSLYASGLSDVLNLVELQEKYPKMYDNVNMDSIVGVIIRAIRQSDSK